MNLALRDFHPGQVRAWKTPGRFLACRCGRRWGKTDFAVSITASYAVCGDDPLHPRGQQIGWFAPEYKFLIEPYAAMIHMIGDFVKTSSEGKGKIVTTTGGEIDTWSLENPMAGRGRRYNGVIIDEAAFAKTNLLDIWERNIRPTLVDYRGWCIVLSNTNGMDIENFFWLICNQERFGFKQYHAPSSENPFLPREELEELKQTHPPLVWQQEFEAEFVDWSGAAFFSLDKLLWGDLPVAPPRLCDGVIAVVDSALKTGRENDATAVMYSAYSERAYIAPSFPLVILDWDVRQIEGAMLVDWLPNVFTRGEELAREVGARFGFLGVWIEDKASGIVLIQQAQKNNWNKVHAIDSKLTSLGKSERAVNASPYVFMDKVKFSQDAFDKQILYKGVHRNHALAQILEFRPGDVEHHDDDALDTFTYSVALSLGNYKGF